jgi:hypothetical protein
MMVLFLNLIILHYISEEIPVGAKNWVIPGKEVPVENEFEGFGEGERVKP